MGGLAVIPPFSHLMAGGGSTVGGLTRRGGCRMAVLRTNWGRILFRTPHGIGAVLLDDGDGVQDVALRLRHLLPLGLHPRDRLAPIGVAAVPFHPLPIFNPPPR